MSILNSPLKSSHLSCSGLPLDDDKPSWINKSFKNLSSRLNRSDNAGKIRRIRTLLVSWGVGRTMQYQWALLEDSGLKNAASADRPLWVDDSNVLEVRDDMRPSKMMLGSYTLPCEDIHTSGCMYLHALDNTYCAKLYHDPYQLPRMPNQPPKREPRPPRLLRGRVLDTIPLKCHYDIFSFIIP